MKSPHLSHCLLKNRKQCRWAALGALLAIAPMASGCYGHFPLTRGLYRFNHEVTDDTLAQSLTMWGLIIIPVYGLAVAGDALIFNLVEFWTGEQKLKIGQAVAPDGAKVALVPSANGREATLTIAPQNGSAIERRFVKQSDGTVAVLDGKGALAGRVVPCANGDVRLTDAQGNVVQTLKAGALNRL